MKGMRAAGAVVAAMLAAMKTQVRPGVTTRELDEIGAAVMRQHGAKSAPELVYGFPGTNCISVNDEVVHGIPSDRKLAEGDLVKLDVTVEKDGFMADAAITVPVGSVSGLARRLVRCAETAFWEAMRVARAGATVYDIGKTVESVVRSEGFGVVRALCGHGIGRTIHEPPEVPNYAEPRSAEVLTEGLVITIEPMISAGCGDVVKDADGWTIRTVERKLASHFEHTIVITKDQPMILTV